MVLTLAGICTPQREAMPRAIIGSQQAASVATMSVILRPIVAASGDVPVAPILPPFCLQLPPVVALDTDRPNIILDCLFG